MEILNKIKAVTALSLSLSAISAHALDAPAAMVPAGLNPGDDFYIIFVTSTTRDATSTDIADYNAFVNTAADLSGGKGTDDATITWRVVGATATDDQCDPYDGDASATPMYNLNDEKVADDRADMLDGSLDNDISSNETGGIAGLGGTWTGCFNNGTPDVGSTLGVASPTYGLRTSDSTWADFLVAAAASTYRLYAVSPKLTVAAGVSASASPQAWD
jgi:hypothetical protein